MDFFESLRLETGGLNIGDSPFTLVNTRLTEDNPWQHMTPNSFGTLSDGLQTLTQTNCHEIQIRHKSKAKPFRKTAIFAWDSRIGVRKNAISASNTEPARIGKDFRESV